MLLCVRSYLIVGKRGIEVRSLAYCCGGPRLSRPVDVRRRQFYSFDLISLGRLDDGRGDFILLSHMPNISGSRLGTLVQEGLLERRNVQVGVSLCHEIE